MTTIVQPPRTTSDNGSQPQQSLPKVCEYLPGTWFRFPSAWVGEISVQPDGATIVLRDHNGRNRRPNPGHISLLGKALGLDQFLLTGETIIFDSAETLINGQNRLHACVKSQKPLRTFCVVGVDPEVFKVLDQHSKRTLGQVLGMMDEKHSAMLASALGSVSYFHAIGILSSSGAAGVDRNDRLTIDEMIEGLTLYPGLRESVSFVKKLDTRLFRSGSMVAALHWIFSQVDSQMANDFFTYVTKATIPPDEPRWAPLTTLHKSLVAGNVQSRRKVLQRLVTECYTIKTWNAVRRQDTLKTLVWRDGEDFPRVDGWKYDAKDIPIGVKGK